MKHNSSFKCGSPRREQEEKVDWETIENRIFAFFEDNHIEPVDFKNETHCEFNFRKVS